MNIGKLIKDKFDEKVKSDKSLTKSKLACRLYINRTTVNHLFKCEDIDINLLVRLSEILDFDFIKAIWLRSRILNGKMAVVVISSSADQLQKNGFPANFNALTDTS